MSYAGLTLEDLVRHEYVRVRCQAKPQALRGQLLALRLVSNLWRQEQQSQNVKNIAEQGEKLYEKFCGFIEDFEKIGNRLRQSSESYESALGKLSTGRGNLIRQSEKLKEMGVRPKKSLPPTFNEMIDNDSEDPKE